MSKKKVKVHDNSERLVTYGDISFPIMSGRKYDGFWHDKMTASELYQIFQSDESCILFCARLGWIESTAPSCGKQKCRSTIFKNSIFYQSSYGPAKVLELM